MSTSHPNTSNGMLTPVLILSGFALVGFYVLVGMIVYRATCGVPFQPESWLATLRFLWTSDTTAFTTPGVPCTIPAATLWASLIGVILVLAAGITWGGVAYARYKESDEFFVRDLKSRPGVARAHEIRKFYGKRATVKKAPTIRPSLTKQKTTAATKKSKPKIGKPNPNTAVVSRALGSSLTPVEPPKRAQPGDVALLAGTSQGTPVWLLMEESILLIGAPRSGKGVHLVISSIIDAPGTVVTTSTRADNYAATYKVRQDKGSTVVLFDPQGLTGQKTTLKWSPIAGCDDPMKAQQRANSLISATGLGKGGSNEEWRAPAVLILQSLLHAAAVDDRSIDDLIRWGNDLGAAREAVDILERNPRAAEGWSNSLKDVIEGDAKMAGSKWFGVSNVMVGLSVPTVRAAMDPKHPSEVFDIDDFINTKGTLYLVGTKTGGGAAGAFLIAMMDEITERAREIAAKLPGNRLDPPIALILDEIANMAGSWPGLTTLMSDGGGVGICPMPVCQDVAQFRDNWGDQAAQTIFGSATIKILLGGSSNPEDLRKFESLLGNREVSRRSRSWGSGQRSTSEQSHEVPLMSVKELRMLPFGTGMLLAPRRQPILLEMDGYWKRKDSAQIEVSKKSYDPAANINESDHGAARSQEHDVEKVW
ncbi:type IV secretory system conjugative DNA transfer family protein [Glutamicibacter uratoxydans]|uniref:type IV secretory system conjugative DNA transfer family protein n=1 Tax=Glutamicibacter uratoxydans TaxID=43667 RepID=UPI003D6F73C3